MEKFLKSDMYFGMKLIVDCFIVFFGVFLVFDDMLWHNIGGLGSATGMVPMIGIIKPIIIAGIHIHHLYAGILFMFIGLGAIVLHFYERKMFKKL